MILNHQRLLETRSIKILLRFLTHKLLNECPKCHQIPIDNIVSDWQGKRSSSCIQCQPVNLFAKFVISRILGLNDTGLTQFSQNPLYVRSLYALLRGIEQFGIQKPQPTIPPIAIVWNFTKRCNLRCSHCYSNSSNDPNEWSNELTTVQALKVVDHIAQAGCGSLSFSGGEPLLREDFYTIAKRTSEYGLLCTLSTNATVIDHTVAKDIAASGVSGVTISIDSLSSKFHDQLRGVSGAHTKALRGVEACVEIDEFKEIILAFTLTRNNIADVPGLIELANELGVTRFYVSKILPVGRGKSLGHLNVSKSMLTDLLKNLAEKFIEYANTGAGVPTMTRGMTYFAPQCAHLSNYQIFPICEIVVGFEKRHKETLGNSAISLFRKFSEYAGGCATGLTYCGLDPEGNVLPCAPATDIKLGNILIDGLESIWVNNPVLNRVRLRYRIEGKCGTCNDKLICGGCRVTAYGQTGNWLASDPSCPY